MNDRRFTRRGLLCGCLVAVGGIGLLGAGCLPISAPVNVRLVNATSFIVDANLYVSSTTAAAAQLFVQASFFDAWKGSRVFPTLAPSETVNFTIECDQVATLGVSQPVFTSQVTGLGARSQDTVVLQRPGDFDCGGTIVLTYSADPNASQYNVAPSVQ